MEHVLMQQLREILSRCRERGVRVYVIGAYSVRAYGYLLRQSFDLDLAVERPYLDGLLTLLQELGFTVQPVDVWFAAEKKVGDVQVAVHMAVDYIVSSQYSGALLT